MKFAVLFLAAAATAFAQNSPARQSAVLLAELNRDIWIPYSEAFSEHSPERHAPLHAPDFVRIDGVTKTIRPLREHLGNVRRSFLGWEERDEKVAITFRFVERIIRDGVASERGIYEFVLSDAEGATERVYGMFHAVSRKSDGKWRLTLEYDTNEGGVIDLAAYRRAAAADDLKRF